MSARNREQKRQARLSPDESKEAEAFYLYCIGEARPLAELLRDSKLTAIEDGAIELIEAGELAAVSSSVRLDDYNEEALQAHLTDAAWTALRAMRHERVVDYFARRASVIPLRFGTIYLERDRVREMLSDRGEELLSALERLRGREEWGVNVFCDRRTLTDKIIDYSPRLRELTEQAAAASPGQAYLMRKKMEAMRADEARSEVKRVVSQIKGELEKRGAGVKTLRILKDEAGEYGELVGKLAFLIEHERFEEFRRACEQLALEKHDAGFRLELTGPWPAYNFVGSD